MALDWGNVAQWLAAIGSISAVVVALWGQQIRQRFLPPKLSIKLLQRPGTEALAGLPPNQQSSLWYHTMVENKARWFPIREVRVYLLKVKYLHFMPVKTWEGFVPMPWRNEDALEKGADRSIGHSAEADLFAIVGNNARLTTRFRNFDRLQTDFNGPIHLRATVQARGIEADSPELTIDIQWDGTWPASHDEAQHVLLKPV